MRRDVCGRAIVGCRRGQIAMNLHVLIGVHALLLDVWGTFVDT